MNGLQDINVHNLLITPKVTFRLDFQTFNIASPFVGTASEGTSKAGVPVIGGGVNYASTGQCRDDFFSVTSAGNPTPPIICGNNNNQHSKSLNCCTIKHRRDSRVVTALMMLTFL